MQKTINLAHGKLTLYKTVVRAHMDFVVPVISCTKNKLDKLEKDQIKAIKTLLKLNYYTADKTMLAITKSTTIRHRMATLKTKFWLTLIQQEDTTWTQHEERSLVTKHFTKLEQVSQFAHNIQSAYPQTWRCTTHSYNAT